MTSGKIIACLNEYAPESYAMSFDRENVGLQVGGRETEVTRVYLAVDATEEVIADAMELGAQMLITHHPMIFGGIRKVSEDTSIGRRILQLAKADICYYAMHTNYDIAAMADRTAELIDLHNMEVLEECFSDENGAYGIGKVGELSKPLTVGALCELVKKAFDVDWVKLFGDPDMQVQRVAISPGSGKGMPQEALAKKAEVLITGDIDHHSGIDAVADGLCIIDAGHYGLEHIFTDDLAAYLTEKLPELTVFQEPKKRPFIIL